MLATKMRQISGMTAALLIPCLVLSGCFSWVAVKPTELTKLNNMTVGVVKRGPSAGRAVAVSVSKLERADGRLIEVKGKPYIRITANGRTYDFKPPISVDQQGTAFTIRSGNRAATTFHLSQIQKVEVRDGLSAAFWAVYGIVLGIGLILAIVLPLTLI